ncbi:MAG: divergent PAP2 family protein [Chloroflexi bacterium]|nr:divergent PAP2 family protein [Chloroflexota bacterium]
MAELLDNRVLIAALLAWVAAQSIKIAIDLSRTGRINFRYLVSSGGMPSAHAALVSALATVTGREAGLQSPLFGVAVVVASVVMYDAAGVRQAAMLQARILNRMLDELFTQHAFSERRLRELLGHTPIEVFAGAMLGLAVGFVLAR